MLLVAPDERYPEAVRRQRGRRRFAESRGQAPRDAAFRSNAPEIVIADEDQRVVPQCRMSQIASLRHGEGIRNGRAVILPQSPGAKPRGEYSLRVTSSNLTL